jgi:hypothetical protein
MRREPLDRAATPSEPSPAVSGIAGIPCAVIGRATLYNADCRDVLPLLSNADAVVTDPPYFQVKGDYWDNEWDNPKHFLEWMRGVIAMLRDTLPLTAASTYSHRLRWPLASRSPPAS